MNHLSLRSVATSVQKSAHFSGSSTVRSYINIRVLWRLGLACALTNCSLYEPYEAAKSHNATAGKVEALPPTAAATVNGSDTPVVVRRLDAAAPDIQPDVPTVSAAPAAPPEGELDDAGTEPALAHDAAAPVPSMDAGRAAGELPARDAGMDASDAPSTQAPSTSERCSREQLTERAQSYLTALASGDPSMLSLHERVRYTENGAEQVLGFGLWLSRPRSEFARHVLDVNACSTATEAVLRDVTGRIVLGLRLQYLDDQLLEVEAQVVPRNDQYYAPENIIPDGEDPWLQPIPIEQRSSAIELSRVAMSYFDSSADLRLLPPSAEGCERRQNGALMQDGGSCRIAPGDRRFEQQRFEVLDETTGIVSAHTKYSDFIGMYLIKVQAGTIMDIEVIGGASAASTGW